jgi:hypothetical protein
VNAVSLKIADQILAEYYGLLEYRGLLWIIVEYYWIIGIFWNIIGLLEYCGIFWNIMEYYGLLPNLYTQIIVASPRFKQIKVD